MDKHPNQHYQREAEQYYHREYLKNIALEPISRPLRVSPVPPFEFPGGSNFDNALKQHIRNQQSVQLTKEDIDTHIQVVASYLYKLLQLDLSYPGSRKEAFFVKKRQVDIVSPTFAMGVAYLWASKISVLIKTLNKGNDEWKLKYACYLANRRFIALECQQPDQDHEQQVIYKEGSHVPLWKHNANLIGEVVRNTYRWRFDVDHATIVSCKQPWLLARPDALVSVWGLQPSWCVYSKFVRSHDYIESEFHGKNKQKYRCQMQMGMLVSGTRLCHYYHFDSDPYHQYGTWLTAPGSERHEQQKQRLLEDKRMLKIHKNEGYIRQTEEQLQSFYFRFYIWQLLKIEYPSYPAFSHDKKYHMAEGTAREMIKRINRRFGFHFGVLIREFAEDRKLHR